MCWLTAPLKIWLTTGRLKKRLIPIFATPTVNVDTVITLVQSVVAIHMWSSLQTDAVKYWHASSFITWSLLSLKMNNHFFLLHWVKCSSKGGSVLWVDISNTTIKVRTIPYDYDGIALTSIYIYIPPMTERQDLSAIQQHMFLIFSLQREKLQLRSWPYACNRKLTFIDSSLNLKHCSVSLEYFYFLLKFIVTIEEPVFHWRYRENRW